MARLRGPGIPVQAEAAEPTNAQKLWQASRRLLEKFGHAF